MFQTLVIHKSLFFIIKISKKNVYYKNMEIRYNDEVCIIRPLSAKLDKFNTSKILKKISLESRRIAIDLSCVQECSLDFIEEIKSITKNDIGFFNIPADVFILFNILGVDKIFKLFVSELDFEANIRQIINRKFIIV